jgi:hypothetical protein
MPQTPVHQHHLDCYMTSAAHFSNVSCRTNAVVDNMCALLAIVTMMICWHGRRHLRGNVLLSPDRNWSIGLLKHNRLHIMSCAMSTMTLQPYIVSWHEHKDVSLIFNNSMYGINISYNFTALTQHVLYGEQQRTTFYLFCLCLEYN